MTGIRLSTQTVLTLNEADNTKEKDKVSMVLDVINEQLVYIGDEVAVVDILLSEFSDLGGQPGDLGKIGVQVSLVDEVKFIEPYITADGKQEIEGLEYTVDNDATKLNITFIEPEKDNSYIHSRVIFHTSVKKVDPSVAVTRRNVIR